MNALNNWIRGCLPQKATLVRAGQSCAVLRAVAARSIPFLKRNIPAIGLDLLLRHCVGVVSVLDDVDGSDVRRPRETATGTRHFGR